MLSCQMENFYENRVWHQGEPDKAGFYLVRLKNGFMRILEWCGGWNCKIDPITGEIYKHDQRFDIVEWSEMGKENR